MRPHKYEIIGGDKYKVDGGQIQSQGARKSVTVTGTNLISKGLASCCHGEGVDCAACVNSRGGEAVNPGENGNGPGENHEKENDPSENVICENVPL